MGDFVRLKTLGGKQDDFEDEDSVALIWADEPQKFRKEKQTHKRDTLIRKWLSLFFALVCVTRGTILSWLVFSLIGRFFIMFFFSIQCFVLSLVAAIGIYGAESWCFLGGIYSTFLLLDIIFGIITLKGFSVVVDNFIYEPSGAVSYDWNWLYKMWIFICIIMAICIVNELAIVISNFIYWWRSGRKCAPTLCCGLTKEEKKKRSLKKMSSFLESGTKREHLWKRWTKNGKVNFFSKSIYWFLVLWAFVTMAISVVSLLALVTNYGNCSPTNRSCFTDCDELDPTLCALPFPSSHFLQEDSTSETGFRVAFTSKSLPNTRAGIRMDPTVLNELDGFSTIGPMLFYFEDTLLNGTITSDHIESYSDADVKTVIINTKTGERVPHWVEKDEVDSGVRSGIIILQPAFPLDFATRYVVGIRGLKNTKGEIIQRSEYFVKMCEETTQEDPRWNHFKDDIFPILERGGIDKNELQLAWDFVTVSRTKSLGKVEWMREDALQRTSEGAKYKISQVKDEQCKDGVHIGRIIWGEVMVPSYMDGVTGRGLALSRPLEYKGDMPHQFLIQIPCSLIQNPSPSFVLQYGHGLFGDRGEARDGYLEKMADEFKWVLFSCDWYGMSHFDVLKVAKILMTDPSQWSRATESSTQGLVNNIVALRTVLSANFTNEDALKVNGISVIDSERFGFWGNSQGGIIGGAYVALSTDLKRASLGVSGSPYALLLSRSSDFSLYHSLLHTNLFSWIDIRLTINLMQMFWDPAEAGGWLMSMNRSPGPKMKPKDILMHAAISDAQVTTLGAANMARAYNCSTVAPQTRSIWGISERQANFTGSAIVEWKYDDVPDAPTTNLPPPKSSDTHECPRREYPAQLQIRDFLETGVIVQYCQGKCEKPKCDS